MGQPKRLLGGLQTNRLLASTGANQDHISSMHEGESFLMKSLRGTELATGFSTHEKKSSRSKSSAKGSGRSKKSRRRKHAGEGGQHHDKRRSSILMVDEQ